MRRALRLLGTLLILGGVGTLGWAVAVWQWQDPFTALYTKWEQRQLSQQLDRQLASYAPPAARAPAPRTPAAPRTAAGPPPRSAAARPASEPSARAVEAERAAAPRAAATPAQLAAERARIRAAARGYARALRRGDPLGRLVVPRLGLKIVLVNGTDHDSLTKGPGRYLGSGMPGEGRLVYVAGHRTTYLAPFSHIDALRRGDPVTVELPYATFEYAISGTRIVAATDLSVLRSRGREEIVLQACHPRFFATQRYLAYARLVRIVPREGPAFALAGGRAVAAPATGQPSLR